MKSLDNASERLSLARFECPLCEVSLSSGDDLQQHVLLHAGEQDCFTCQICSKVCQDAVLFGKHLRIHTGEKPFQCGECDKSFREKCSLTRHRRTHTGEKPFTCEICDKSFSDVGSFGRHKKTHMGSSAKVHECPFSNCGKSFIDKSSLKRHVKTHTGEKPFQCQICNKCFTESGSYKRHLRIHTGEKRYKCRSCGRAFSERASMVRHERNVCMLSNSEHKDNDLDPFAEESKSPYSLNDVFRSFVGKTSDALNNNICRSVENDCSNEAVDLNSKEQTNKIVDSELSTADYLSDSPSLCIDETANSQTPHESSHMSSSSSEWSTWKQFAQGDSSEKICNVPPKMIQIQYFLEAQSRNLNKKNSDVYMCFECGDAISDDERDDQTNSDSASSGSDNKRARRCRTCHQESITIANGESSPAVSEESAVPVKKGARHTCSHCGKAFADSSKLKRHVKIHLNLRDFKCQVCGKGFIEACSLRRHESIHLDVKPHNCPQCGKGFTDSSGLKKHFVKCNGQINNGVKVNFSKVKREPDSNMNKEKDENNSKAACLIRISDSGKLTAEVLKKEVIREIEDERTGTDVKYGQKIQRNSGKVRCSHVTSVKTNKTEAKLASPEHQDTLTSKSKSSQRSMICIYRECDKSFDDKQTLNKHCLSHAQNGLSGSLPCTPVSCQICGKMFVSMQYLHKHMKKHNGLGLKTTIPVSDANNADGAQLQLKTKSVLLPSNVSHILFTNFPKSESPQILLDAATSSSAFFSSTKTSVSTTRNISTPLSDSQNVSPQKACNWNCEVCGKVFADASSLKRHSRLHTEQQQSFPCENCDKVFWDQGSLKRHWLRGCQNVSVVRRGSEAAANQDGQGSEDQFACTQCRMEFGTREEQMTHEKAHRVSPALRCTVCRKSFPDAVTLKNHLRTHETDRPYSCEVCFKGFGDSGSLTKHRARGCYAHAAAVLDPSKLRCIDCGKVFSDQVNFDQHVSSHKGVKPYSCSHCGKSFTEACSLKRHTRLHTGQNLCRCLHCGRTFLENSGLKKHLQRQSCQQEKKPVKSWLYPCNVCQKVFSKRYILFRHMKTHLGLRPFACDKCDKSFTESSSLKRHYRQHTGERPYHCQGCNKSFTDAGVLKKHSHRCPYVAADGSLNLSHGTSLPYSSFFGSTNWSAKSAANSSSSTSSLNPACFGALKKSRSRGKVPSRIKQSGVWFLSRNCWRCGRSFPTAELQLQHTRAVHSGFYAFKCTLCWRRFSRHPYLRVHQKQHDKRC